MASLNFKINLIQLLSLMTIAAAVVHLSLMKRDGEPFWRSGTLAYVKPEVPVEFRLIEDTVRIPGSNGLFVDFADGRELYLKNFKLGWSDVRRRFYRGAVWAQVEEEFDFYEEYDLSKLRFRANWDQAEYCRDRGRRKCRDQIVRLLLRMDEPKLRQKLAYPRQWQYVPGGLIILVGIRFLFWKRSVR